MLQLIRIKSYSTVAEWHLNMTYPPYNPHDVQLNQTVPVTLHLREANHLLKAPKTPEVLSEHSGSAAREIAHVIGNPHAPA